MVKACGLCGLAKPLEDFHRLTKSSDGRQPRCKVCVAAYMREYHQRNAEAIRAKVVAWRRANPERFRQQNAQVHARLNPKRDARTRDAYVEHVERLVVLERDDGICGICGTDVDPKEFHVDHIVPLARGGAHGYSNVQVAHPRCNKRKYVSVGY